MRAPPRRAGVVLSVVALLAATAGVAHAEKFAGEGSAPAGSGDVARAREKALALALEAAVIAGARDAVGEAVFAAKEKAIRARLIFRTAGFVKGYRITAEAAAAGTYKVTVEATVDTDRLRDELRTITGGVGMPGGGGGTGAPAAAPVAAIFTEGPPVGGPGAATAAAAGLVGAAAVEPVAAALGRLGYAPVAVGAGPAPTGAALELRLRLATEALAPLHASDARCVAVRLEAAGTRAGAALEGRAAERAIACAATADEAARAAATRAGARTAAGLERLPTLRLDAAAAPGAAPGVKVVDAPGGGALLDVYDAVGKLAGPVRGMEVDGDVATLVADAAGGPALAAAAAGLPKRLPALGLSVGAAGGGPTVRFTVARVSLRAAAPHGDGPAKALRAALAVLPGTLRVDDASGPAAAAAALPSGGELGAPVPADAHDFRVWHPGGAAALAAALAAWTPPGGTAPVTPRVDGDLVIVEIP